MEKKKVRASAQKSPAKGASSSDDATKKLKLAIGLLTVLAILLFPKPQQITYEYANIVSEGTYWDGLIGSGMLFDSSASFVRLDDDTNHLHVCFSKANDNCLRYKVLENRGFGGYIASWFE